MKLRVKLRVKLVFLFCLSPSSLHDVLVYQSISEDVFVEELIGEEHQQRGDGLKQDAVSDVTAKDTEHTHGLSG